MNPDYDAGYAQGLKDGKAAATEAISRAFSVCATYSKDEVARDLMTILAKYVAGTMKEDEDG